MCISRSSPPRPTDAFGREVIETSPQNPDVFSADAEGQHIHTLRELIDPATLSSLRKSFSNLCGSSLAFFDADGARLDRVGKGTAEAQAAESTSAGFLAPVAWRTFKLGSVGVLEPNPEAQTKSFATLIANILSVFCRQEARIRRRVGELSTIYGLGVLFAHTDDFDAALNITAQRVCNLMHVKAASIRLLDEATGELIISGSHNIGRDYLNKGRIRLDENPIDQAAFSGQVVYIEDARSDPRVRFREHAKMEGMVSGLCCPMSYRGQTVGVLRIYSQIKRRFSTFDVELLQAISSLAAGAIVSTRLSAEARVAERYARHLRQAGQIQRRMIPRDTPVHPRVEFGHVYKPSLDVGGDFFDFLDLPKGNVGVAIADVVGKGLPGALMMASVRSALRAHAQSIFDIDDIVGRVNRHMCRETLVSEFATLFYGVISPDGRRFTYCNAGHNPPFLVRGDSVTELGTGGLVIGVLMDSTYDKAVVTLEPGDFLIFYTDGVTEAVNYDDELYGFDRLCESVFKHRHLEVATMTQQLLWDVRRFAGLADQSDDITIVVAKVS
ncbi:MAG: SpoIIE family protein phosphatase [Phycisphaerales bacterium]|nr:SpoIIE family protein phosphatase [Phycisphaerales bacterium]